MDELDAVLEKYGLATILEQNDLTERDVLQLLLDVGWVDLDDYTPFLFDNTDETTDERDF